MTETNKLKVINKAPTQPKKVEQKLITLTGITTSQINQALKADNPYPARVFLKLTKRYCQRCEEVEEEQFRCSHDENSFLSEDIPVFFRIKEGDNWIKPKIKKGSYLQVEGYFSVGTVYTKQSERKSFTAISYQLLACPHSQKKPYFCPIDCPCLKKLNKQY